MHVRRGAHLQGNACIHDGTQQRRVLAGAHPVPEARGGQRGHDLAHGGRPQELAAVWDAHETGAARDAERGTKRSRGPHALVVRQAKTHDLAGAVARERRG